MHLFEKHLQDIAGMEAVRPDNINGFIKGPQQPVK